MAFWLMPLVAVISTAICLYLWFRDVRRIMTEQKINSVLQKSYGEQK